MAHSVKLFIAALLAIVICWSKYASGHLQLKNGEYTGLEFAVSPEISPNIQPNDFLTNMEVKI